jgi:hypothetical protein
VQVKCCSYFPFGKDLRTNLAKVRLSRGDAKSALPLAEDGWQRRRKPGFPPEHRAESAFVLARVLWAFHGASGGADRRRRAEARTLAREALDLYEAAGPGYAKEVQDIRQWLASPR